ncbi:MAG TPA: NADH:flavin oxidoreductase, partial [Epsilonproteobacteria bacterium]|nr:NADH:flavin oxidoreductase [Campylobacterota bacterium]
MFESAQIGSIKLRNRFLRSGTHEGMAEPDGAPAESLEQLYVRLAKGEVGAVITGYAGVMQQGKSSFQGMLMMHDDGLVPAYRRLVNAVHRAGAPIIMQLAHCGRQTRSAVTGRKTVAPSSLKDPFFTEERPLELTDSDVRQIIEAFSDAA